jgi:hypothetical protein
MENIGMVLKSSGNFGCTGNFGKGGPSSLGPGGPRTPHGPASRLAEWEGGTPPPPSTRIVGGAGVSSFLSNFVEDFHNVSNLSLERFERESN